MRVRVAISCAGKDEHIARGLIARLTERGFKKDQIFYGQLTDPQSKLGKKLRRTYLAADTLILIISENYEASTWCRWEYMVACARIVNERANDVHMVLLDGAKLPAPLAGTEAHHGLVPRPATRSDWQSVAASVAASIAVADSEGAQACEKAPDLVDRYLKGLKGLAGAGVVTEVMNSAAALFGLSEQRERAAGLYKSMAEFERIAAPFVDRNQLSETRRAEYRAEVLLAAKKLVAWAQGQRGGDSEQTSQNLDDDVFQVDRLVAYLVRHFGHKDPIIKDFLESLSAFLSNDDTSLDYHLMVKLYVSVRAARNRLSEHFWQSPPVQVSPLKRPVSLRVLSAFRKRSELVLTRKNGARQ